MKIIDCFTFFNELEILELRFNELYDYVDTFVIVESTKTHTGLDKELVFSNNINQFSKFLDKVTHVVVDDLPTYKKSSCGTIDWVPENFQRNAISRGLDRCAEPGDIILVSDCDEIWDPRSANPVFSKIRNMQKSERVLYGNNLRYTFMQAGCFFYINTRQPQDWWGTAMAIYGAFDSCQHLRNTRCNVKNIVNPGGWHFSYQGGASRIYKKVQNIAESSEIVDKFGTEFDIQNKILNLIDPWGRSGINIKEEKDYLPEYITTFTKKYPSFVYNFGRG